MLHEPRAITKIVKSVFKSLPNGTKRKNNGILHVYYEKPVTRMNMLNRLKDKDIFITSIRVDKRNVFLSINPNELYKYGCNTA